MGRHVKIAIITATVLAASLVFIIFIVNLNMGKTLTKNYGASNMTINVNSNGVPAAVPDIDSVVPSKDKLIENLTGKGYSLTRYNAIGNLDIPVSRIYAEKNGSFIDICYGLTITDAKTVFKYYEDTYDAYYLMAQNKGYVYCIRDKETFKNVGFNSLANDGIQYIYQ